MAAALIFSLAQFKKDTMEKVTIISMHATYGLAALLFLVGAIITMCRTRLLDPKQPPPVPVGKVMDSFYRGGDLIAVALISGFFYGIVILSLMSSEVEKAREVTVWDLIFNIGLQFFLVGLVLVIVVKRINPIKWLGLKWNDWHWVVLVAPMTVFAMWIIFAGLELVSYYDLMKALDVNQPQEAVELLTKTQDVGVLIWMAITAVIVAPVCEEIVFRGYVYPVLKKFSGRLVAAIVSGMLFAAAHGSLQPMLPLFILGITLVYLYEWSGSIWAPISVHMLFNGATVAVQMMIRFGIIPEKYLQ